GLGNASQQLGVPQRDLALAQCVAYCLRSIHQGQASIQRGSRPAQSVCSLVPVAIAEGKDFGCRLGLFGRAHVCADDVLQHRGRSRFVVVHLLDQNGYLGVDTKLLEGSLVSTRAGNHLVAIIKRAYENRLQDTALSHGCAKLLILVLVPMATRVVSGRFDAANLESGHGCAPEWKVAPCPPDGASECRHRARATGRRLCWEERLRSRPKPTVE